MGCGWSDGSGSDEAVRPCARFAAASKGDNVAASRRRGIDVTK